MPATGSSTRRSLRILGQQHADLEPLLLPVRKGAGETVALVAAGRSSRESRSMPSRLTGRRRFEQGCKVRCAEAFSASRRLSSTVWFSKTVGFWNLRPMPRSAMPASSILVRSMLPSKKTSPVSGRVLPVMTSIIVVLPAPFGPMIARISPGSSDERKAAQRLVAVEGDADAVEIEERGGASCGRSSGALGNRRGTAPRRRPHGGRRLAMQPKSLARRRECPWAGTRSRG